MRVPLLPLTLELRLERDQDDPAAPVFVARPLNMTETLDEVPKFVKAREQGRLVHFYADLFRARVDEIRGLTFGEADEAYDPKKDAHLDALAGRVYDVIEIGSDIWNRAQLEERAAGK